MIERWLVRFIQSCPVSTTPFSALWSPLGLVALGVGISLVISFWYKSAFLFFMTLAFVFALLGFDLFCIDLNLVCKRRGTASCSLCIKKIVNYKFHCVNGPAVICKTGKLEYRLFDLLHRYDGPAIIDNETGSKAYYLHGYSLSEESYVDIVRGRSNVEISSEMFSRHFNSDSESAQHAIRVITEVLGEPNVARNLSAARNMV